MLRSQREKKEQNEAEKNIIYDFGKEFFHSL
jgi:hypothetical protein